MLPLDKKGEMVRAHPDFQLVVSYNPGYQSRSKDMKPSTRQRFAALEFGYPSAAAEADIVCHETGIAPAVAQQLVGIAHRSRALQTHGLDDGISTRMLVYAAMLIADGLPARASCEMALVHSLSDDPEVLTALRTLVQAQFASI